MITAASLKSYTVKDLAEMAKRKGVSGVSSMRKAQLVRALLRIAKAKAKAKEKALANSLGAKKNGSLRPKKNGAKVAAASKTRTRSASLSKSTGKALKSTAKLAKSASPKVSPARAKKQTKPISTTSPSAARKIRKAHRIRAERHDLSTTTSRKTRGDRRDRVVLMVRGPFWLHACWEIGRQSVDRAQAALAEHWHGAKPILRLFQVASGPTTSAVESVLCDIDIHGGVNNWYIDVLEPPCAYRVEIGYLTVMNRFYSLSRSNKVETPPAGKSDSIDENWTAIAEDYEKVYAMSGGYDDDGVDGELQDLFEERLRRPMGTPMMTNFGPGAERALHRESSLPFEVDAEMLVFGSTKHNAHVTLAGEPVKLRPDGTFTVRMSMPDRRQVLPVVASSSDGVEQKTIVLAIERNTKTMEPIIRETVV